MRTRYKPAGNSEAGSAIVFGPAERVPALMKDLFAYLKDKEESTLIKSCVFHYEMEFIHPFMDGNGRMGRLWQTLILMSEYPLFEFLPFETLIAQNERAYYNALSLSDKQGKSTAFIAYLLRILDQSLTELLQNSTKNLNETQRLTVFLAQCSEAFTRKDYLPYHTSLSAATGSRDLRQGVEKGQLLKFGDKNTTFYKRNILD